MSISNIITEALKPEFYTRVAFASLVAAQNVAAEDPGTANHANRIAYASRIIRGDDKAVQLAMHLIASNPTITGTVAATGGDSVPDGDIQFAMNSLFDARANAFAALTA